MSGLAGSVQGAALPRRRWDVGPEAARYGVLLLVAALVLLPLFVVLTGGFKTAGDLRVNPFGLPSEWNFGNYRQILGGTVIWRSLGNSLVLSLSTVVLTLLCASLAGFAFAQVRFRLRGVMFSFFLLGLLFPAATAILPLFILVRDLGLLDSVWGIVLPQSAFGLALSIVLLRGFFRQLPPDLWGAASIDGCGHARFLWHVVLPLSRPVLATVAVIVMVQSWNSYLLPLTLLNSSRHYPWTVAITEFATEYSTDWQMTLAFITLTLLPAVAFFLLAQRQLVAGLTGGAVKG